MKKCIILCGLLVLTILTKAQSINDNLYHAIVEKDTLLVEKFLNNGADASYIYKINGHGNMPLLTVAVMDDQYTTVKLLLDHRADVNQKDWFDTTALMYAAYKGDLRIIEYLLANGADIHAHDNQGNTVLSSAKEGKHSEAIKIIENKLNTR